MMLFFSLPVGIPIPVISGLTAIPLIMFAVQMIRGMDSPWLPQWIAQKRVKRTTIAMMIEKAAPYLKRVERLMRPRFSFASSHFGEKIIGIFALVFSISILLPLPLSNFIPAVGVLLMALGLLSKDGITIILGMIVGTIGVSITILIVMIGQRAVMELIGWI